MKLLKQSTAVDIPLGPFVDSADGVTPETGLTLSQADVRLKKNGGAWAQKNQTSAAAHEENGNYEVSLNSTDTDTLGILRVFVNEAGALPVWDDYLVVPATVYDALVLGTDKLQVHADEITNGLITAAAIATGAIDADAIAADAGSEIAAAVWDADATAHQTSGSFGQTVGDKAGELYSTYQLAQRAHDALVAYVGTVSDATPAAGGFDTSLTQADGYWDDALLSFTTGTLAGQTRPVSAYLNAAGGVAFDEPFTAAPANGDAFTLIRSHVHPVAQTATAVWASGTRTLTSGANIALAKGTGVTGFTDIDAAGVRTAVGLAAANLDTQLDALPTAAEVTTAVWAAGARTLTSLDEDATTLDLDATIRAAVGMASANLDTQLGDLPTNAELSTALAAADDAVLAAVAALNNLSAAQVNAEVVDALATDTYAEPTGAPAATATLAAKINYLYMALRNKVTVTSSAKTFCDDAGNAEWSKALSDDGTTYTEAEGA